MTWGVDYPWSHPTAASLQAAGASFAMRYLSTDQSKNLSRAEADSLAAHGIWCGVVWETTAGRALAGQAAGAADARTAAAQASACGMPDSRPIYFAVDTDTDWASVRPYFAGVSAALGPARTGVYGGLHVVQGAAASGLVTWYWQTSAWSGGVWDPRAHLRQGGSITIGGVDCDRNTATTTDYGQWMPGRTPTPPEDIVTPQDIQAITDAVAARLISDPAVRDSHAYAVHWWLQNALAGQIPAGADGGWSALLPQLRSSLGAVLRTEGSSVQVRDANAFAVGWWLQKALTATPVPDAAGQPWGTLLPQLTAALSTLPPAALATLQTAVGEAVKAAAGEIVTRPPAVPAPTTPTA